jgi:hypothetical protein
MYDIEHIYLFDKSTIRRLFVANGFEINRVSGLSNSYTLAYAVKMFPLPTRLKTLIVRTLKGRLAGLSLRIPAGNMTTVGRKRS